MSTGFRIKLSFYNLVNERNENLKKSWIFVNRSVTRSVSDFAIQIKDKFDISKSFDIHLELDGFSLPLDECIDVLRDNDEIRVIKHGATEQELKRPILGEDNKYSNSNAFNTQFEGTPLNNRVCVNTITHPESSPEQVASTSFEDVDANIRKEYSSNDVAILNKKELSEPSNKKTCTKYHEKQFNDGPKESSSLIPLTECVSKNKEVSNEKVQNELVEDPDEVCQVQKKRRRKRRHGKAKHDDCDDQSAEQEFFEKSCYHEESSKSKKSKPDDHSDFLMDHDIDLNTNKECSLNSKFTNHHVVPTLKNPKSQKQIETKTDLGKIKIFKRNKITPQTIVGPAVPLLLPPAAGSVIKFKILEMSTDYTPIVSDLKKAEVLSFCPISHKINLRLIDGIKEVITDGRFELTIEDQDQILTNKSPTVDEISVHWSELLEPQLA